MEQRVIVIIIAVLLALCCCLCVVALAVGGYFVYEAGQFLGTEVYSPTTPTKAPVIVRTPVPTPLPGSQDTLAVLEAETVPQNDMRELAMRLKGIPDIPEVVSTTPANYALGDEVEFNVSNMDTNENFKVTAELVYETANVYFFVEKGLKFKQAEVKKLVDQFQTKTYPTNREFFGSEWTPGVDGDPHLYMLYASGIGGNAGGYYDSASEYSKLAHPYSNEKEMFVLVEQFMAPLSDPYWPGTLAHEFQHMIHWYHDRNETTWMNEGSSMLAEELNGYDPGSQSAFLGEPDLQLNTWSDLSTDPTAFAHYDSAYLFMKYFLDRFGEEATQTLIADPANGLQAVDNTLAALGATDPATGQPATAVTVFADWVIANYLNDRDVGQGQYGYAGYSDKINDPTAAINDCPHDLDAKTVRQFAADYYAIECAGTVTLNFSGSQQVQLIPTLPRGRYAFWSNREDESDAILTRAFDLTSVSAATLKYGAWWQIEKDYDYAYLEVSTDDGQTWQIIRTASTTDANPTGANMGWGYTGCSGGGDPGEGCSAEWVEETVDLSAYAGQKIQVRFEYVTDAALNYPGLMVDDLSIPEIDYTCGFEQDECGWDGQGFVRIDNLLPQTFVVQVILDPKKGAPTVQQMELDASNQGSLTLDLQKGDTAILVVSGTTPFTTEEASYQFEMK